eukprot:TRINITY_DN1045_c1_g1_i2.p1 TRINITY_DN1045_c1_g1~~TRINITY_DN1045_c1_g1_i2.p1  ORF type:complete len:144 (+),score=38.14 TRINITY_DN1045_c1_g1_i2:173-604(+)
MKTQCVAALALAATATGFLIAPMPARTVAMTRVSAAPANDIQALTQKCLDEGCSVDMVDELITGLKARRSSLILQLATVDKLLHDLEGSHAEKQSGAVNDVIKSVARLFSKGDDDYPMLSAPTGYSGDSHRGTKDAWDYKVSK